MRLLIVIALLAGARVADAACATLMWMGLDSGNVPVRGSLYVYDESESWEHGDLVLRWEGHGRATSTPIARSVARIDYEGSAGSELVVLVYDRELGRYRLDATWSAPARAPRATHVSHAEGSWQCSSYDTLVLRLDQQAAAVRVRWTFRGSTSEWILPARGTLELGKLDCGDANIPPEELHEGGTLALFAIRADRSEVRISNLPAFLSVEMVEPDTSKWAVVHRLTRPLVHASFAQSALAPRGSNVSWFGVLATLVLVVATRYGLRKISE